MSTFEKEDEVNASSSNMFPLVLACGCCNKDEEVGWTDNCDHLVETLLNVAHTKRLRDRSILFEAEDLVSAAVFEVGLPSAKIDLFDGLSRLLEGTYAVIYRRKEMAGRLYVVFPYLAPISVCEHHKRLLSLQEIISKLIGVLVNSNRDSMDALFYQVYTGRKLWLPIPYVANNSVQSRSIRLTNGIIVGKDDWKEKFVELVVMQVQIANDLLLNSYTFH